MELALCSLVNATMSKSTTSESSSNKAQKTNANAAPTLDNALLKETGIIRSLVSFTTVTQTLRLLAASKNFHAVNNADVFRNYKLPTVCHMISSWRGPSEEFKMYRAMVRTPNSQWLEWLDTSGVKELKMPPGITDEEMLIIFDNKRFSKLQTLNLCNCRNITGASLAQVTKNCSNLQSLDLSWCRNITLSEVGIGYANLQLINLAGCINITDASVSEIARHCLNLQSLDLYCCIKITDVSLREISSGCPNLQSLDLRSCRSITSNGKHILRQSHPQLKLRR